MDIDKVFATIPILTTSETLYHTIVLNANIKKLLTLREKNYKLIFINHSNFVYLQMIINALLLFITYILLLLR